MMRSGRSYKDKFALSVKGVPLSSGISVYVLDGWMLK